MDTTYDRGVSSVMAVVLMVAITVILAAVVGNFVISAGNSIGESPPAVSFETDFAGGNALITHSTGNSIKSANLQIKIEGSGSVDSGFTGTVTAGDSATVTGLSSEDTIRVVWTSVDGSSSSTLLEREAP